MIAQISTGISLELFLGIFTPIIVGMISALAYLWKNVQNFQKKIIEDAKNENNSLKKINLDFIKNNNDLESKLITIEIEKNELKTKLIAFASSHEANPLPQWVKDRNGILIVANKAYENRFLKPRGYILSNYIGHTDDAVWPTHIAQQYRDNDLMVLTSRKIMDTTELITSESGEDEPMRIIKYPRYIQGIEEPFGVSGIAIPESLDGISIFSENIKF